MIRQNVQHSEILRYVKARFAKILKIPNLHYLKTKLFLVLLSKIFETWRDDSLHRASKI